MRLISLTAYPKSGVTYLSSLLFYAFFPGAPPGEIERRFVIDIHIHSLDGAETYDGLAFYKNHYHYAGENPLCRRAEKAIYLIRDPIDVMRSAYDFMGLLGTKSETPEAFTEQWLSTGGDGFEMASTWPRHVTSWLDQTDVPVLLLRYDDLVDRPLAELERVFAFLGVRPDASDVATAIENSTMKAMRAREEEEYRAKRPGVFYSGAVDEGMSKGARFINRGYRRSFEELDARQRELAKATFGDIYRRYLK